MAKSFKQQGDSGDESTPAAYQLLVESTFDGVLALSSEGNILWADDRFLNLAGYDSSEIENKPLSSFMDPGDEEKVHEYISQSLHQSQTFDVHAIDKSGKVRIFQLVTALCGEEEEQEIVVGVRDISEEDTLRKRIVFTDKMDLLSRIMNSIGGDLGRITSTLGPIVTGGEDPQLQEALDWLSELEHRIDLFPRRGIKDGADVDIPALVEQAIEDVKEENPDSSCDIRPSVEDGIFPVFGDTVQLSEAIRNVLRNACQAADSNNGDVKVSCRPVSVDRATPMQGFILPSGKYVHLTITDTGPGISPDIIDHVFDPMFSTKTGSPLAGLGLAVTYTVVKNHRGYIALESNLGSGTTVEFYMPKSKLRESIEEAPAAETPAAAEPVNKEVAKVGESASEPEISQVPAEKDLHEATVEQPEGEETVEDEIVVREEVAEESTEIAIELGSEGISGDVPAEKVTEEAQEVEAEVEVEVEVEEEEKTEEVEVVKEEVLGEDEIGTLSGHETILIIEEDHESRAHIIEIIENFGYNALPARNWVEGVDLYKRHARLVDLVLLNVLVPEMVWVKTLMDLRKVEPQGRISLLGGEETSETMVRYLTMPGIAYLAKPLSVATLMRGVRFSLDEMLE